MFDQRELSIQIVQAKGDYLWIVKDNQEGLREEIEVLFQPHRKRAGTSAPPNDFRTARTVEKGHGRKDMRTITVSSPAFGLQHVAPTGSGVQVGKPKNQCTWQYQNRGAVWRDEFARLSWPIPNDSWH